MDLEVPCRDTDPVENANMEAKVEPLAFTIDFGDSENIEEKAKKFERFAQRSSQRKVKSPRQEKDSDAEGTKVEKYKQDTEDKQIAKVLNKEKSNLVRTDLTSRKLSEKNVYMNLNGMERLDINNARKEKEEVNDEVSSQTGTYTMEEEEELNQVIEMMFNHLNV